MVPTYRNSYFPSFPFELNNEVDHDLNYPFVSPNYQVASSSSYSTCQTFYNSTTNQDQIGYDHSEFYQPQHQPEVDKYVPRNGSHGIEKKHGLKITLWKKGNNCENKNDKNPVKNLDRASMEVTSTDQAHTKMKLQDQKQHQSTSLLGTTDHASNSSSNNLSNIPIRVCSDCHTTKTPLWRSGPQGPKSLCNACGIRQRKARRAMAAAAAAAANGTNLTTTETSAVMKIKVQQQKQKITKVNTNHVVPFKKRCKFTSATDGSSSSSSSNNNAQKKLCFEDFFINLSNNLAFHRVFPQDEKEAAILLMAISSGLVHG